MTIYPENVREFVTQKSVPLGDTGWDVEVEIARRADVVTVAANGEEVLSIGLGQYCPVPPMAETDLLVIFDLGTVLDLDDLRFSKTEHAVRLPVKGVMSAPRCSPVRVPAVLRNSTSVSLLLAANHRPFGTLTVDIRSDGTVTDSQYLSEQDGF